MKILVLEFITSVGGVQTVYKNILPYLSKKHEIYFLDPYENNFDKEMGEIDNLKVLSMPIKSEKALGWTSGHKIKILTRYGFIYFKYLLQVIKLIKQKQIDMLYVSGKKEIAFAYIIRYLIGKKYIYHAHGFNSANDIGFFFRVGMNSADTIIPVSKSVKSILLKAKISEDKVEVVYNGLNLNNACNMSKLIDQKKETADNVFTIIFIGAIQPKKGIDLLIKAINILLERGTLVKLNILGEVTSKIYENYYKELEKIACNVDKSNINFCGFQNNVYEHIKSADLLVLPSTEESFGMVLLEAMYMSKPVIGSKIGGIPEVIEDGVTGLVFKANDVTDLVNKIETLYNNYNLRISMGKKGRERLNNMFTAEVQASKILDIIGEIEK